MRYYKKLLAPALATALGVLSFTAGSALADGSSAVAGLSGFDRVAVNSTGDVFLSGSNGIAVIDSSGTSVGMLDSGANVVGLALSGSTLYAAVTTTGGSDADSIDVFDLSSVASSGVSGQQPTQSIPLEAGDTPVSLAFQSGYLWVSYTDASGAAGIGSVDSGGTFTPGLAAGWSTAPSLVADPSGAGSVVAVGGGDAAVYTASSDGSLTGTVPSAFGCSDESQLAVLPGSGDFYAVCGTTVSEYSSSLSQVTSYTGNSVAVNSAGDVAVGAADGGSSDVDVYGPDGGLLNVVHTSSTVVPGGLSWDGSAPTQLDAVTGTSGSYNVETFGDAATTTHSFTLAQQSQAYEGYVPLKGTLSFSNGQLPSGSQVTITRTLSGAPAVLGTATVGSDGSFTLTDTSALTPGAQYTYTASYGDLSAQTVVTAAKNAVSNFTFKVPSTAKVTQSFTLTGSVILDGGSVRPGTLVTIVRHDGSQATTYTTPVNANGTFSWSQAENVTGTFTFTANYDGDPTLGIAASGSVTGQLNVVKMTPVMSVSGPTQYTYEPKISVTVHLGATYTNRTVAIYAQTVGSSKRLLAQGKVNASGNLTVTDTTPHSTTFTAVFGGDARYAARTITHTVTVAGRTAFYMNGWYTYQKVSGTTYRLYHQAGHLDVDVNVGPNKYGECVWFEVQEYYNGAWHPNMKTSCASLSASSYVSGYLAFTNADLGYDYRIRAHYLPPSTDVSNAAGVSGWQYAIVKK